MGVPVSADGVDGLLAMPGFADIKVVFDATSAAAHRVNWAKLRHTGCGCWTSLRPPSGRPVSPW